MTETAKTPYLNEDGSFALGWISERAATRAHNIAVKGYRRETERELFHEFLAEEMQIATTHLDKHKDNQKLAFEDIVWALINSKEFLFNH